MFYESTGADVSRRMSSLCEAYEQQLKGLEQNLAVQVLDLAFDIARQLIRSELATQPKAIEPMVHEAVNLVLASGAVTHLRLARPDLEALQDGLAPLVESGKLRCSVDPAVTPGGCILESGLTVIDASLEKRWTRVLANFGRHPAAGEVVREVRPGAPVPQLKQPVVAQAVFDVGAPELDIEGLEIGLLQLAESHVGVPVGDPGRQRVLGVDGALAQRGEPGAVALAKRLACFEDGFGRGAHRGWRSAHRVCGAQRCQQAQRQGSTATSPRPRCLRSDVRQRSGGRVR